MSGTSADKLALEWIPGGFAVCRLSASDDVPSWAAGGRGDGGFLCITHTDRELSIVAPQEVVPDGVDAERGWVAMRVAGELDFSMVGVLSRLTGALADAGVSVFAVSTYDTDVMLVKSKDTARAVEALRGVADVSRLTG